MVIASIYSILFVFFFYKSKTIISKIWFSLVFLYSFVTYTQYVLNIEKFNILKINISGDYGFKYGIFLVLSFSSNFFVFFILEKMLAIPKIDVSRDGNNFRFLTLSFYSALTIALGTYFFLNQGSFSWGMGANSLGNPLFSLLYRIEIPLTILVVGMSFFENSLRRRAILQALSALGVLTVCSVALKAGSRSDLVYMAIGLFALFLSYFKPRRWIVLTIGVLGVCVAFIAMQFMVALRGSGDMSLTAAWAALPGFLSSLSSPDQNWVDVLLAQDYFAPSATLAMSIEKDIIIPLQALQSNLSNSLYMIHGDTISTIIVDKYGLEFLRGAGFGYFIYTEGYNYFGMYGFLYNGIFWGLVLYILNASFLNLSKAERSLLYGIFGFFILQIIRNQSGIVFKTAWSQLLPALFIYWYMFRHSARWHKFPESNQI